MKLFSGAIFALAITFPVMSAGDKKAADLARVAILNFTDKTGTKNFGYMPGSLQEAITTSMHAKFEFTEIEASKVEPIARTLSQKSQGVIDAKAAAEICRKADIDILIFGSFSQNPDGKAIQIVTNISLGSTDKFFVLNPTENAVDATIFKAADKVAADIVAEITRVAQDQEKEKTAKGKAQLAKSDKSKAWADMNWAISVGMGVHSAMVSQSNTSIPPDAILSGAVSYRLKNRWHIGAYGSFGGFRSTNSGYRTDFDVLAIAATVGYFIDLSARWRLTTLAGGGYYFGTLNNYIESFSSNSSFSTTSTPFQPSKTSPKNPMAVARVGIHYLLFSFLALGIEATTVMYYDNKPLLTVGANAALTFAF